MKTKKKVKLFFNFSDLTGIRKSYPFNGKVFHDKKDLANAVKSFEYQFNEDLKLFKSFIPLYVQKYYFFFHERTEKDNKIMLDSIIIMNKYIFEMLNCTELNVLSDKYIFIYMKYEFFRLILNRETLKIKI